MRYAGIAGALIAIATAFVSPDTYGFTLSVTVLIGAVLGGLDSLWGALFGGLVVEFLPLVAQRINAAAPSVVYGVALIAVMLLMPGGIAGTLIRALRGGRGSGTNASAHADATVAVAPARPAE